MTIANIKDINNIILNYKYQLEHFEKYKLIIKIFNRMKRYQGRITNGDEDISHICYYFHDKNRIKEIEIFINYDGDYEKSFMS